LNNKVENGSAKQIIHF